jgi:hypothetical protein
MRENSWKNQGTSSKTILMKPKRNERKLIEKSRIIIKRSDETQEK